MLTLENNAERAPMVSTSVAKAVADHEGAIWSEGTPGISVTDALPLAVPSTSVLSAFVSFIPDIPIVNSRFPPPFGNSKSASSLEVF